MTSWPNVTRRRGTPSRAKSSISVSPRKTNRASSMPCSGARCRRCAIASCRSKPCRCPPCSIRSSWRGTATAIAAQTCRRCPTRGASVWPHSMRKAARVMSCRSRASTRTSNTRCSRVCRTGSSGTPHGKACLPHSSSRCASCTTSCGTYSHPHAWSEIGFGGPANPRGYVRMTFDRRDPWKAAEAHGDDTRGRKENSRVR